MAERISAQYLSVREQQDIINKLASTNYKVPWRDAVYMQRGRFISAAALLASTLVFWRSAFRGYNLFRYGRARSSSLALSCFSSLQGVFFYEALIQARLEELYAEEDPWVFARRAAFAHNCGLATAFISSNAMTYVYASRSALVPIMKHAYPEGTKCKTLRYIAQQLRPYYRSIATVWVGTTLIMSYVGYMALKQRQDILYLLYNRKSISRVENGFRDE